ncbi:MAG: site-specific DNA-methyltransferase, partial [Deltaproteobacteria bacterium]|nr:site-specific DNA-methyltransferase [Deltaproteobacteria bacterium]
QTSRDIGYRRYVGELWTSEQRQMHSLHYIISYRASFKPELPEFCIRRYSNEGDIVLDPFSGRGTTALQANLMGRVAYASDVNPLAVRVTTAKTNPVGLDEVVLRLNTIDFRRPAEMSGYQEHFAPFYHPDTFRELLNLRTHVKKNRDRVNNFVELLALSRLHGHSQGFFSVYSFPQISIPAESQRMINLKRRQVPEYRAVAPRIIRKAAQSLRDGFTRRFWMISEANRIQTGDARDLDWIPDSSVDLVVTSPPFLDKVDYVTDNWLEVWFGGFNEKAYASQVVMSRSVDDWTKFTRAVLEEMLRVIKPRGCAVVEVGEVESGGKTLFLDEIVAQQAAEICIKGKRFVVEEVLVNQQSFTKLANCFRVDNNRKGTNTNRLVVLKCVGSMPKPRSITSKPRKRATPPAE